MWWQHKHQGRIDKKTLFFNTNGKFVWGIYNKKGKYSTDSMETTRIGIEKYFNIMIHDLIKGLKNEKDNDDW